MRGEQSVQQAIWSFIYDDANNGGVLDYHLRERWDLGIIREELQSTIL